MSEITNNIIQYFCDVCGKNPNDTPKILKRYRPDVYIDIYYCGNCENHFIKNRDGIPTLIHPNIKKWIIII